MRAREDMQAELTADAPVEDKRPIQGRYSPYRSIAQNNSLTLADVKKVTPSRDVRGFPNFLVDYKGGSRVTQYFDPRRLGQI